ncbi:MAG: acyltransferase [Vicinamibacterales bacterium]
MDQSRLTSTLAPAGVTGVTTRAHADRRNVSLDTLRALAIVLVLCAHTIESSGHHGWVDVFGVGGVGVDLFFCLSGWLLGRQLLLEWRNSGTVDVPRFWARRWMRTLPAYAAVLAWTLGQSVLQHKVPVWWPYLVFLQNYSAMPFFGVSWSLCVEEYFYLGIAPLLLLVTKHRRWLALAAVLLAVPSISRLSTDWVNATLGWGWHDKMTHLRYDQCAAGVLLAAVAVFRTSLWARLSALAPVLALAGLGLALLSVYGRLTATGFAWGPGTWTVIFTSWVLLANSSSFWRLEASIPGASFVANRAYALYLVHSDGIAVANRLFGVADGRSLGPLPLYLLTAWTASFIGAELLYRLVELPGMRARESFPWSRSRHLSPAA